jgi:hypothetical protein
MFLEYQGFIDVNSVIFDTSAWWDGSVVYAKRWVVGEVFHFVLAGVG